MLETPSISVPIPSANIEEKEKTYNNESKCSYNTFDPSSSPPQSSDFLKILFKRIDSFDKNERQEK